jgi:hypothetical protein
MPGARSRRWPVSERLSDNTPASDVVKYTPFNPQELRIPEEFRRQKMPKSSSITRESLTIREMLIEAKNEIGL